MSTSCRQKLPDSEAWVEEGSEPTILDLRTSEEDRSRAPLAAQGLDTSLWQQVQTLRAQVEALQAEVSILREWLVQTSRSPYHTLSPEPPHAPPRPQPTPLGDEADAQQGHVEHEPAPVPSEPVEQIVEAMPVNADQSAASPNLLITLPEIKTLPATQRTQHAVVERLAAALTNHVWLGVLAWLAGTFLLTNFVLHRVLSASLNIYVAQPFLWSCLAIQSFLYWRYGLEDRPPLSKSLVLVAILTGAFQVAIFVIAGLFFGFGRSPSGRQPLVLLGNLVYAGTMMVGMEMSRACLMAIFSRRSPWLALAVLSLLFSFVSIPFAKFRVFNDAAIAFRVTGETLLPTISQNLLASLLTLIGGPVAPMAYRGILLAFEWLSPILPNLQWIVAALLGTLVPILGSVVIYNQFLAEPASKSEARPQKGGQSTTAWVLVGVAAVALLWFNTGLFGVRPTFIASGSMIPELLVGDVVITRDVPPETIEEGDVIRFQKGDTYIIHRVIEIQQGESEITFITRGDNNDVDDPPVPASDLAGKVIFTVPKIGWVTIGMRKAIEWIL